MAQAYILLAIFLWSSIGIVVRLSGVPIHIFIFYSLLIAVSVQFIILLSKGQMKEIKGFRMLRYPMLLGLISLVNSLTFFYAFKATTISNAVLTHYTAPIIVAFLAGMFLKEKITGKIISAIIIASVGLLIMLGGFSVPKDHLKGIISGLFSGFAYALIVIVARRYGNQYRPLMLTFVVNLTIVIALAPFIHEFPSDALWSFLVMGIVHSTIAPVFYYRGLQEVSASRTAVLGYLEPVCAIILSMVFLGEIPGLNSLLGGILIMASRYITIRAGA